MVFVLAIFGLMLSVLATLFGVASSQTSANPANIPHLVRMGLIQASLSTIASLTTGIAIAWALNRLNFPGRSLLISLLATAIVAPGLVVALGVISVWGNAGWANQILALFSQELPGSIFGLHGILLAHTVLNGAFAAHLFLARLQTIPAQKLKTGQSLALSPLQRFLVLDWPVLSNALPPLASIIFLLTFTSFPIVLLLGGGPANQTLEVAIYAAVRFSFDLNTAVSLALIQLVICTLIILPALFSAPNLASTGVTKPQNWHDNTIARVLQIFILCTAIIGFAAPLLAIIVKGIDPNLWTTINRPSFINATITSLIIGIISAALTIFITLRIAMARLSLKTKATQTAMSLPLFAYLLMPSVVLALGFFISLRALGIDTTIAAPFVLIVANVLLALPFAFATIFPPLQAINQRYAKLSTALNLSGNSRWKFVEWPNLGREIGLAGALAFCFSLGDLAIISLFGTANFTTLPWAMFRAMGAYRTNEAATIAALILILCLGVFWILPTLFSRWAKQC